MKNYFTLLFAFSFLILSNCKKITDPILEVDKKCYLASSSDSEGGIAKITYDDNGRVITFSYIKGNYENTSTYVYLQHEITEINVVKNTNFNATYKVIYSLDKFGRIESMIKTIINNQVKMAFNNKNSFTTSDEFNTIYSYNQDGYLIESKMMAYGVVASYVKYTWNNGNIIGFFTAADFVNYEYANQPLPDNFFYNNIETLSNEFTGVLRNYFGKSIKNLPSKKSDKNNSFTYTYSFDVNGSLNDVIEKNTTTALNNTKEFKYTCK